MPSEFYNEEEAQAILKEASRHAAAGGAMSRDRLLETAAELGIPPEAVLAAEETRKQQVLQERQSRQFKAVQSARFYSRASKWLFIGLVLAAVFFATREEASWALIVAGFFLLRAVMLIPQHFMPQTELYQQEFNRWKRKQEKLDQ